MKWSRGQSTALDRLGAWLKSHNRQFALGGYAGTGKTTLARHIAAMHDGSVFFAATTGKAASVLARTGCPGACTIHALIYRPKGTRGAAEIADLQAAIERESRKPAPDEKVLAALSRDLKKAEAGSSVLFEAREDLAITRDDLIIVDECSMIDQRIGDDLGATGAKVLYLGDPGQLPPVRGKAYITQYDYTLEEIHRQAKGSAILALADTVRRGRPLTVGEHDDGTVTVAPKSHWDMDVVSGADQVLTGKNATRTRITRAMRRHLGHDGEDPAAGEKLVVTKNNGTLGVLNGIVCRTTSHARRVRGDKMVMVDIDYDGRTLARQLVSRRAFQDHYGVATHFPDGDDILQADYGYCLTGHKAQGSEWEHVVVADDRMRVADRAHRSRWLYTVITRAKKRLTCYV